MPTILAAPLMAWLATAQVASGPFGPLQQIDTDGGPTVLLRRGVALPLVAIRLSLPVDDGDLPGATRVLVELGRDAMGDGAAPFGGRVSAERLPGFAVFSVVGPARSFDAMVALLHRAVGEPRFDADALARARARAARQVGSLLERPETRTRALLRQRLFLDSAGVEPGIPAVDSLTPDRLRRVWSTQFRPERMRAIVVGDLSTPAIRAAFSHWRRRITTGPAGPGIGVGPRPEPQVMFPWAGIGYRVTPGAVAAVATELIRRQAAAALTTGTAELWWQRDGGGLVVLGSVAEAAAEDTTAGARLQTELRRSVAAALAAATADAVADAARTIRVALLLAARTAAGAAEVTGRFIDASGQVEAPRDLVAQLSAVDAHDVRTLLRGLMAEQPVSVEVGP
ncbi:MAG: hypothetical protein P8Z36_13840 [Gemmatimonadota bacterium]